MCATMARCLIRWMKRVRVQDLAGTQNQFRVSCIALLIVMSCGSVLGWCAPAASLLFEEQDTYLLEEWALVPVLLAGSFIITPFASLLSSALGRWSMLIISGVLIAVSWLLIAVSNYIALLISRFLAGLASGAALTVTLIYLAETTQEEIWDIIGAATQLMFYLGVLIAYIVVPLFWWVTSDHYLLVSAIILAIIPIIYIIPVLAYFPETPYHLLRKYCLQSAKDVLIKLRNPLKSQCILLEVENICDYHTHCKTMSWSRRLFENEEAKRSFVILMMVLFFEEFSGFFAILYYVTKVFRAQMSDLASHLCVILVGVTLLVSCFVAARLVNRTERKSFLFVSLIATSLLHWTLTIFYSLDSAGFDMTYLDWIPVLCIVLLSVAFSMGLGPLPIIMLVDMLPIHLAAGAALRLTIWARMLSLLVTMLAGTIIYWSDMYILFLIFTVCSISGAVYVYYQVPEYQVPENPNDIKPTEIRNPENKTRRNKLRFNIVN